MERISSRPLGVAVLVLSLASPTIASADTPSLPSPDKTLAEIRACLDQADAAGGVDVACENVAMDKCVADPRNETTQGSIQCSDASTKAWDTLLNQFYRKGLQSLNDEGKKTLRDAQRAWIPYRDKSCAVWRSVYEGGSLGRQLAADCIRAETARRALELRDLANPY